MGATKSWVLHTDPNAYHAALEPCKALLAKLEEHTATFKGYVERPGGSHWESKFADAAQANAGGGYKTVAHMRDLMDAADRQIATTIDVSLTPQLTSAKHLIEHALQQQGVTVNDDLSMTYTPPKGMSDEDADHNRQVVQQWAKELKASADQAWAGAQTVAQQANAAGEKILGELNSAAALFNVDKAVADTRPKDAPPPPQGTGDFYKDWYPKATPASTEAAAVVAPADPTAPKYGPPVPDQKPAVDPKSLGSLGSVTGILDANRKPDERPAEQPAPQNKGFLDGWIDAAKQKGEGLLNHVEDMVGMHGAEKAKDAWIDTGIGVGKDMLRESLGIKDPTPLEQTFDAYSKAQYAKDHGLSGSYMAGQDMFDYQAKNAALAAEAATMGGGKFVEKGVVEGAIAADARAAMTGAAAPTVDSALTNSIKGFFENATTPHVEAPSIPHIETPSLPHVETPAAPHIEVPAAPHIETTPAPHVETPAPRVETPPAPHAETSTAPHAESPTTPHVQVPAPHLDSPEPVNHAPQPGDTGHHAPIDQSGHPGGDIGDTGAHTGASHQYPHYSSLPEYAQQALDRAVDNSALRQDLINHGVPPEIANSAAHDPYAGMTQQDVINKHYTPNGGPDWPSENGFRDGKWNIADRIPANVHLDRIGEVSTQRGDFMATQGDSYPSRSLAPGSSGDYHAFQGTGRPLKANWELRYGEVGPAFEQPGGGTQWIVVDKITGEHVLIETLIDGGYLR